MLTSRERPLGGSRVKRPTPTVLNPPTAPYAPIDGNNFYGSCERVFAPPLVGKPVVVLSSNDGTCIARSNEAKDMGVKMAQPWVQVRHLQKTAGLIEARPTTSCTAT